MMKNMMITMLSVFLILGAPALVAVGPSNCGADVTKNLIVGSEFAGSIGFVPFETNDTDLNPDNVIGFDASVASEIANRLGFPGVTFQQAAFQNLLPVLTKASSPIDIVIAAMSIAPQNQVAGVSFVNYNSDSSALVFVAGTPQALQITDGATALVALNALAPSIVGAGNQLRLGVTGGSREGTIINENNDTPQELYPNLLAAAFGNQTLADQVAALKNNNVQALFVDGPTAQTLVLGESETGLPADSTLVAVLNVVDTTNTQNTQGLGIAIPSSCCQLYVNIQQAITDMVNDGTLARLRAEFNLPATFVPVTTGLAPAGCTLKPTINSNAIANYIFSNYCPRTVTPVTTPVTP